MNTCCEDNIKHCHMYLHPYILFVDVQDVLQEFSGKWELRPVVDGTSKQVLGTQAVLNQEIQPKGIDNL